MSEHETPDHKKRIAVLDGLRALAITLVMFRHGVRMFWPDMTQPFIPVGPTDLGYFFMNGWIGVDLFFVLSGFLITNQLLGSYTKNGRMDIKLYAKRRFFRIAPVYYVVLAMMVLGVFSDFHYTENKENLGWRFFYHVLFLQDYLLPDINPVFWSLAVEIKFYLLAPFLLIGILGLRTAKARYVLLAALFLFVGFLRYITASYILEPYDDYTRYFLDLRIPFHLCMDGLLAGVTCSVLLKDQNFVRWLKKPHAANILFYSGVFIIVACMFSGVMVELGVGFYDKVFQGTVIAVGFSLMLLGLMGDCFGAALFRLNLFYYIALISYSMYLLHLPLFYVVRDMLEDVLNIGALSPQVQFLIFFPAAYVVVSFFSMLSYLLIERPFILWSHRKKVSCHNETKSGSY